VAGDRLIRIDPGTWDVADTVEVGSTPTDVAFDNAGTRAYVTNQLAQSISEVDPATDVELRRIPVPGDPYVVTVAPGDSLLYVSTNAGRVFGVSLPSGTIGDTIVTGIVNALVVRDTLLYAGLPDGGEVRVYDRRTNALVRTLATGGRPQGLAFSPDGSELYVADEQGGLQFWDVTSGTRLTTLALATAGAFDVAVQPGTGRPFVTTLQGTVHAVDPGTRTEDEAFALGGSPRRIAFRANGDAIVANETGWVDVIR
jgi:YVTN family beta-propeller protein